MCLFMDSVEEALKWNFVIIVDQSKVLGLKKVKVIQFYMYQNF